MKNDCVFCSVPKDKWVLENDLAYALYDINPEEKGHMLIITKGHYENIFATPDADKVAISKLLIEAKKLLDREFNPSGYNVKTNIGKEAGQVVFHTHVHLVPRYE